MNAQIPQVLEELLQFFPEIDPPINLTEEVAISFSKHNRPLPQKIIDNNFKTWDTLDEYSELIPCFQLKLDGPFYAIVYWKGSIMSYEYILLTLDQQGLLVSKKVIAGTISNGASVLRSAALIDEDNCVYSTVGESSAEDKNYNPTLSKAYRFEILPDGHIKSSQEELMTWEEKEERNQIKNL